MEQIWAEEFRQGEITGEPGIVDPHEQTSAEGLIYEDSLSKEDD